MASYNSGTTNTHFKEIQEGLLDLLFPMNYLRKKYISMHNFMKKPCAQTMKRLTGRPTEINTYLPLFPGSNDSKKMGRKKMSAR